MITWRDVFFNTYGRLKRDFKFICNYGYIYAYSLKHNSSPSVVFKNGLNKFEIGYDFIEDLFYANFYYNEELITAIDCNTSIKEKKKTYKNQIEIIQERIKFYLSKIEI